MPRNERVPRQPGPFPTQPIPAQPVASERPLLHRGPASKSPRSAEPAPVRPATLVGQHEQSDLGEPIEQPRVAGERLDLLVRAMQCVADSDGRPDALVHELGPLGPVLRRALGTVGRQIDRIQRFDQRCSCADTPITYDDWLVLVTQELSAQIEQAAESSGGE